MKDRADFARKGIARGRSVVVLGYDHGIAFVAENQSRSLHKIGEIYDRIAFAAVGKYNEFENLRVAGVRYADLRGYSYDRSDVTARGLANAYAQTLGTVFTQESKPYEVEIVVAEVGRDVKSDQIYRLTYDGSVADEHGLVAMGGASDQIEERLTEQWRPGLTLAQALQARRRGPGARPRRRSGPRGRTPPGSRSRCSTAPGHGAPSAASTATCSGACSPRTTPPTTSRRPTTTRPARRRATRRPSATATGRPPTPTEPARRDRADGTLGRARRAPLPDPGLDPAGVSPRAESPRPRPSPCPGRPQPAATPSRTGRCSASHCVVCSHAAADASAWWNIGEGLSNAWPAPGCTSNVTSSDPSVTARSMSRTVSSGM